MIACLRHAALAAVLTALGPSAGSVGAGGADVLGVPWDGPSSGIEASGAVGGPMVRVDIPDRRDWATGDRSAEHPAAIGGSSAMFHDRFLPRGANAGPFRFATRTAPERVVGFRADGRVSGAGAWARVTQVTNLAASGTFALSVFARGHGDLPGGGVREAAIAADPFGGMTRVPLPGGAVLLLSAGAVLMSSRLRRSR